jgi:hypothetical protein
MDPRLEHARAVTRRHFLSRSQYGLGALAFSALGAGAFPAAGLLARETERADAVPRGPAPLAPKTPQHAPRAKSVIYLHMAGSPPQQELFDWKPELVRHNMQPCPEELLENIRFAFIKGHPKMLGTPYKFQQHGQSGTWVSELLPQFAGVVDDVAVIRSMHTDQFNHAPAQLFLYTGAPRFGNASLGSWITYGLGSENQNLPGFVVLVSGGTDPSGGKSLWGNGFLPSVYQGVQCRTTGDPILYVSDPPGMSRDVRRESLDAMRRLNEFELEQFGDPETLTRIEQYELAFRMQSSVPDVMDIKAEPKRIQAMYGTQEGKASFANNCLLARRLVERGVRYAQLFDWGWDIHGTGSGDDIMTQLPKKCREVDQSITALITDLKQRGLLDETLIIWSGEFGRTAMNEARNGSKFLGRDHHPHSYTMWMAGGGIRGGVTHGATDPLGYFPAEDPVSVHDLQATVLHLAGLDPHRFSFRYQGLDQRLIGPEGKGKVLKEILA